MFDALKTIFWRGQFDGKSRRLFYTAFSLQLKSGVQVLPACDQIYDIYSNEGKTPNRVLAIVAQDCAAGISQGTALFETLAAWIPYDEQSSIEAGAAGSSRDDGENRLALAFDRAVEIIDRKEEMRNALIQATAYPCFVLTAAFAVFYYLASHILPKLIAVSTRPGRPVEHTAVETFSTWFAQNGPAVGVATIVMVILIFASFPRLTGPLRLRLDRFQPWSTYRTVQGAIFIYNVGVILAGGSLSRVQMLERMLLRATPYMRERIDATLNGAEGVREGQELGNALRNSGFDFPGRDAIAYIRVIGKLKGSEERLKEFGNNWMDQSILNLKGVSVLFRNLAIIILGGLMLMLGAFMNDMGNGLLQSFGIF